MKLPECKYCIRKFFNNLYIWKNVRTVLNVISCMEFCIIYYTAETFPYYLYGFYQLLYYRSNMDYNIIR